MISLSSSKLLGAIAVPAFIVILVALNALELAKLNPALIFNPPLLIPTLNTLFQSMLSLGVAYFSARGYLTSGSMTLLFLGSGALAYGLGPLGAWFFVLPGGTNIAIAFSNIQFLLASILSFAGVFFVLTGATKQIKSVKPKPVYLMYLGIVVFATSLAVASVQGVLPLFFVPGVGGTPLRSGVLMVAVVLFAVSSVGLIRLYFVSKSDIVYWYGLALGLISVGLTSYLLQRVVGEPITWTGMFSQYTGCVCFLIAMLTATRAARARLR